MPETFQFNISSPDPLGVLESTAYVMREAGQVSLDAEAVTRVARSQSRPMDLSTPPEDALHCRFLPPKRRLNYLLALESLNFSFWDAEPRWRVAVGGQAHDGYWALIAAFYRGLREFALPVWDAHWLANLEMSDLNLLLKGGGNPPPMLQTRLDHLREAGAVLLRDWGGQFANLVREADGDAATLARMIATAFPSFKDEAPWRNQTVRFYKRAQICVADLVHICMQEPGESPGTMEGMDQLTAFADYKVPQVLRKLGILVLSPELASQVDDLIPIELNSEAEVEIRAATIWGCEWLVRALNLELAGGQPPVTAAEVDALLWVAGQNKQGLLPYHRTRSPYY